jgi:hypothetical protein
LGDGECPSSAKERRMMDPVWSHRRPLDVVGSVHRAPGIGNPAPEPWRSWPSEADSSARWQISYNATCESGRIHSSAVVRLHG